MSDLTRREFFNICSKENLKHIFGAMRSFEDGVKEKTRRPIDDVAKKFLKNRNKKTNLRKEG